MSFGSEASDQTPSVQQSVRPAPQRPTANVILSEAPPRSFPAETCATRRVTKNPPKPQSPHPHHGRPERGASGAKRPTKPPASHNKCHSERSAATVVPRGRSAPRRVTKNPPKRQRPHPNNGRPERGASDAKRPTNAPACSKASDQRPSVQQSPSALTQNCRPRRGAPNPNRPATQAPISYFRGCAEGGVIPFSRRYAAIWE